MPNPTITVAIATPDPSFHPTTLAQAWTSTGGLKDLITATLQGTYTPYVMSSSIPAVDDQDKIWFKLDGAGRPLGAYKYYSGNWVRVYPFPVGTTVIFVDDPTGLFDGTGLGVVGTDWYGWAMCLTGDADVVLADGSTKSIKEIVENKLPVSVRCYDEENKRWTTETVDQWFEHDSTANDFVRVKFWAGRQFIKKRSITATKEHPFLTEHGWKRADELKTGDSVYSHGRSLTHTGRQAFLGMFLGDGSINRNNGSFSVTHGRDQAGYSKYVAHQLGIKYREEIQTSGYGEGLPTIRYSTCIKDLYPEFFELIEDNKKVTPRFLKQLGAAGLAFWYMDDGHLAKDARYANYATANLNTQGFRLEEQDDIESYFRDVWGLTGRYYEVHHSSCHNRMWRFDQESTKRFLAVIAPFIHLDLRYKLPDELAAHPCVLKEFPLMEEGMVLRKVFVRDYVKLDKSSRWRTDHKTRYDIRVPNYHNFVANGFVVHNCNGNNGCPDFSNVFPIGSSTYSAGWKTTITGTSLETGGASEVTLDNAHTYRPASAELVVGKWGADGNAASTSGNLYGTVNTDVTKNTTLIGADAGQVNPVPISIVPPFRACALLRFVGYA